MATQRPSPGHADGLHLLVPGCGGGPGLAAEMGSECVTLGRALGALVTVKGPQLLFPVAPCAAGLLCPLVLGDAPAGQQAGVSGEGPPADRGLPVRGRAQSHLCFPPAGVGPRLPRGSEGLRAPGPDLHLLSSLYASWLVGPWRQVLSRPGSSPVPP